MKWEDYSNLAKGILLVCYAAKEINLNGDGVVLYEQMDEIMDRENFNKKSIEEIEKIRWGIKDNKNECKKLIYGVIH